MFSDLIRILYLEDDPRDAELMGALIKSEIGDVEIQHVNSGEAYRSALEKGNFDLILSDYTIPSFSGLEALNLAHERWPQIPFIFLSGTIGEERAVESLIRGATDYVLKTNPMRLQSVIRRALYEAHLKQKQGENLEVLRFQSNILKNVTDGIIVTDLDLKITFWNEGAEVILGYSAADVMGQSVSTFILSTITKAQLKKRNQAVIHDTVTDELKCASQDGKNTWIVLNQSLMRDTNRQPSGYLFVFHDITLRKQAEEELVRLNNELEVRVSQRTTELQSLNEDLASFSYTLSHDLRSPIRSMVGFARILAEDYKSVLNEEGYSHIQRILDAGNRAGELIDDILKLSQISQNEMTLEETNLTAMAHQIIAELRSQEPEREVKFFLDEGLIAHVDRQFIRIALTNLLENAWKFSAQVSPSIIQFGCDHSNPTHPFFVRDNGVGFNATSSTHLFEPFQRFHPASEFSGTGIGLSTVYRVVQKHGGKIWAESEPSKGACFYFTLGSN